jgi:thioester reductase-like protein
MKLLITGASGYLGKYIIRNIQPKVEKLYLLVQKEYLENLKEDFGHYSNVEIIAGDIKNPLVFDREIDFYKIKGEVDALLHTAGCNDEKTDLSTCYLKNVRGTQNILQMAKTWTKLKTIHYVSTLAVVGDFKGILRPELLDYGQKFSSDFAKSKFEAEKLFREYDLGKIKKNIYRLGHLVGESADGKSPPSRGPYNFFEGLIRLKPKNFLINTLKYLPLPIEKEFIIPLIPVNQASEFIVKKVLKRGEKSALKCYHVYSDRCPTLKDFVQESFDKFGFSINIVAAPKEKMINPIMEKIGFSRNFLDNLFPIKAMPERNVSHVYPKSARGVYSPNKWDLIDSVKNKKFNP